MPKKSKKLARRDQILSKAIDVIDDLGIAGSTSYAITKKLGISQPAFFYYFGSQIEFQRELMRFIVDKIHEGAINEIPSAKESNWDRVKAFLHNNIKWSQKRAEFDMVFYGLLRCNQDPEIRDQFNSAVKNAELRLFNIIAAGIADGEFKPEMPARPLALYLHKMFFGTVLCGYALEFAPKESAEHAKGALEIAAKLLGIKSK